MNENEKIITSIEMRLRLIDIEYNNLEESEMIKQIKRIYTEEYGEKIPANIDIFQSSESSELKNDESGYDGTAIHFSSKKNNINEVYVISQGSQGKEDWVYNVKAMFAGKEYRQASAVDKFVSNSIDQFQSNSNKTLDFSKIPVIGLSHSLAHNNNTTAHLAYGTFDKIYSVNGAQTNYYQLYLADDVFAQSVRKQFSISRLDEDAIYDLDPNKLREFAENYYKDEAKNIHQLISKDDPLYAVSGTRGFFTLGDTKFVDTDPNHEGLRPLIDKVPDHVIKDFQEIAIQYTVSSRKGGIDAVLKDILGINMSVIREIDGIGSFLDLYFTEQEKINAMLVEVNKKLPGLMEKIKTITGNSDVLFGELLKAGYVTSEQKDELVSTFQNIEKELVDTEKSIETLLIWRNSNSYLSAQIGADFGAYLRVKDNIESLMASFETLQKKEYQNILHGIISNHGIAEVLAELSGDGKSYIGNDMVLSTGSGDKMIQVNISATLRMYTMGKVILSEKEDVITKLESTIEGIIYHAYEEEKRQVINKINDMESNPIAYTNLLRKHVYYSRNSKTVRGINVHETLHPLHERAKLDTEVKSLHMSIVAGHEHLEIYRKSIEELFDEEKRVALLFDLMGG
ncbi:hypothetical protein CFK40_14210 [Virgibacillus necropolis]|uniref:DUF6792 domain-containing protein n=2 Tax=Virgibacillus necropolis TaxID=163877 RepID=A0A221MIF6_9BACI|nr:hypothetical protein CFK40_14210 [Virgibacillus necropolis]